VVVCVMQAQASKRVVAARVVRSKVVASVNVKRTMAAAVAPTACGFLPFAHVPVKPLFSPGGRRERGEGELMEGWELPCCPQDQVLPHKAPSSSAVPHSRHPDSQSGTPPPSYQVLHLLTLGFPCADGGGDGVGQP
jgi:hypothetical protein